MADWFNTSTGRDLINKEMAKCVSLVPSGYYANSLQVGLPTDDYLADLVVSTRYLVDKAGLAIEQACFNRTMRSQDAAGAMRAWLSGKSYEWEGR